MSCRRQRWPRSSPGAAPAKCWLQYGLFGSGGDLKSWESFSALAHGSRLAVTALLPGEHPAPTEGAAVVGCSRSGAQPGGEQPRHGPSRSCSTHRHPPWPGDTLVLRWAVRSSTQLRFALNRKWLTLFPAKVARAMCGPRRYRLHNGVFMSLF